MPLPQPSPRQLMHTRQIECKGYERSDGMWDIEAHLVDTKTYEHVTHEDVTRAAGDAVHDMWVRLTIDLDMLIHDAEASTDQSPYRACGNITPNFKRLKGMTIGPGWRKRTLSVLGGTEGCTHLVELLVPMATTAYQATGRARNARAAGKPLARKPYQIDGCHMYVDNSPTARQRWPQYYADKP